MYYFTQKDESNRNVVNNDKKKKRNLINSARLNVHTGINYLILLHQSLFSSLSMFSSDCSSISAFIFCLSFIVCMLKCLFD